MSRSRKGDFLLQMLPVILFLVAIFVFCFFVLMSEGEEAQPWALHPLSSLAGDTLQWPFDLFPALLEPLGWLSRPFRVFIAAPLYMGAIVLMRTRDEEFFLSTRRERQRGTIIMTLLLFCFPYAWGEPLMAMALLLWALAYHILYGCYQRPKASFDFSSIGATLAIMTLLRPSLVVLLPLLFLNAFMLKGLSLRTACALLLGFLAPFFCLVPLFVFSCLSFEAVQHYLSNIFSFTPLWRLSFGENQTLCVFTGIVALMAQVALIASSGRLTGKKESLRVRLATQMWALTPLLVGVFFVKLLPDYLLFAVLPTGVLYGYGMGERIRLAHILLGIALFTAGLVNFYLLN